MITVTSPLWVWQGEGSGRWFFLTIPEERSAVIRAAAFSGPRGFGSVKVEVAIGDVTWRTSVFPTREGGYLLPVKAEIRRRAGLSAGDAVTVAVALI